MAIKMISREQYEAAYNAGLRRHDGEIDNAEVSKILTGTGMEDATASILAGNVSYMLEGKVYKRAQSIPATDDFLTWIRRDRPIFEYQNAIRSVRAHIEYYESSHKTKRKEPWEVLAKHEALAGMPRESAILLEYKDAFSRGYVDILPMDLFADDGWAKEVIHVVRSKAGKDYQAKCDISVVGFVANLNYEPYPAFNEQQGMFLGMARITFDDSDRTSISRVEWKPEKSNDYEVCRFESPAFLVPPALSYQSPVDVAKKSMRLIRERPGQVKFRRNLKSIYGNCCCITGCAVPQVLEAAHIDPYLSEASDNVRNGLLLRCDLHSLFDRYLIGVEPETLRIRVSSLILGESNYSDLDGETLSTPSEVSHRPDSNALSRHWKKFNELNRSC